MASIPSIEYELLEKGDKDTVSFLKNYLNDVGFFAIKNHPLPKSTIKDAFDYSRQLFDLTIDQKIKYKIPNCKGAVGYTPYGIETALTEKIADQKEFWHHGSHSNPYSLSNVYPNELDDSHRIDDLFLQFESIAIKVLDCFKSFNIEYAADISEIAKDGNSVLRLIHYPKIKSHNKHRARAHTDVNLITLLVGGNDSGLEAQNRKGEWVDCDCKENEIICNVGDMLEIISNGALKSTVHRVVSNKNPNRSRYSIPFFLHPRPEVILNKNTKITANEFLTKRLQDIKLN
jgi:isopenicillin N synthase-like dioxygenase|tara:strand:- start:722 stop:1585 length:864 start_codon:yes stop_codon:yes gene_type:complete